MQAIKKLLRVTYGIAIFVVTLVVLLVVCLMILSFSPIYIFRKLVSIYSERFRPDLGKILSTKSALIASSGIYDKAYSNVSINLALTGQLDEERLKKVLVTDLIQAKDKHGNLKYPEFQQSVHQFAGFLFWKWDKQFNINNHVRVVNNVAGGFKNGQSYIETLNCENLERAWPAERSPWQMLVILNYEDDRAEMSTDPNMKQSMLIYSFHHCLNDGFSAWKALSNLRAENTEDKRLKIVSKSSHTGLTLPNVFRILKSPFDIVKQFSRVFVKSRDGRYSWGFDCQTFSRQYITLKSHSIPFARLKEIKKIHNVTVSSVFLTAMSAGMQRAYETKSIKDRKLTLPKYVSVGGVVPMAGHPDKLRNHMSFALLLLPVGAETSSKKRLELCNKEFERAKGSSGPLFFFFMLSVLGGVFNFMVKRFADGGYGKIYFSNFPGAEVFDILGHEAELITFRFGMLPGIAGMSFAIASYKGNVTISVSVDKTLLTSRDEVQILLDGFMDELNNLLTEAV